MVSAAASGWAEHRPEAIGWYWESAAAPHRDALLTVVERFAPFDSVLDLGCHCGPIRRRLRDRYGSAFRYVGVDVNASALAAAKHYAGAEESFFYLADLTINLDDIPGTFDLVLSSGCLTCVHPSDFMPALVAARRKTIRALIAQEPYAPGDESVWVDGTGWAHPYPSWVVRV